MIIRIYSFDFMQQQVKWSNNTPTTISISMADYDDRYKTASTFSCSIKLESELPRLTTIRNFAQMIYRHVIANDT